MTSRSAARSPKTAPWLATSKSWGMIGSSSAMPIRPSSNPTAEPATLLGARLDHDVGGDRAVGVVVAQLHHAVFRHEPFFLRQHLVTILVEHSHLDGILGLLFEHGLLLDHQVGSQAFLIG